MSKKKHKHSDPTSLRSRIALADDTAIIPEGIQSIGKGVFSNTKKMRYLVLPSTLREIGPNAFLGCEQLEELILPEGLRTLGNRAFSGCKNLKSVHFPDSLRSIGVEAFSQCIRLTDIVLPPLLLTVDSKAFMGCSGLKRFEAPGAETKLGDQILLLCPEDMSISLPAGSGDICSPAQRYALGLPDKEGFLVHDGRLLSYTGHANPIHIPEGVETVPIEALTQALQESTPEPVVIELPDSFKSLELPRFTGFLPANARLRFPPDILDRKRTVDPATRAMILRENWVAVSPTDSAYWFFHGNAEIRTAAADHIRSQAAIDALLEQTGKSRSKESRWRLVLFFLQHRSSFTQKQTNLLGKRLYESKTGQSAPSTRNRKELPYPESIMDEILIHYEIDPDDEAFRKTRYASSGRKAPASIAKAAIVPYLADGIYFTNSGYGIIHQTAIPLAEADRCAELLNPGTLSDLVATVCSPMGVRSKYGILLPFAQYASEQQMETTLAELFPSGVGKDGFTQFEEAMIDALPLSNTISAISWLVDASSTGKYFSPIASYVRQICGEPLTDPVIPSCFFIDDQGRISVVAGDRNLLVSIGEGLSTTISDSISGKKWQRMPKLLPITAEQYERAKRECMAAIGYLKELKTQIDQTFFELYYSGEAMETDELLSMLEDPLLVKALSGIIWYANGTDFVFSEGQFTDVDGNAVDLGYGPIQIAHVLDVGMERMAKWKARLEALNLMPWLFQLQEPAYSEDMLRKNRYKDTHIRVTNLRFPGSAHFLHDHLQYLGTNRTGDFISFSQGYYRSEYYLHGMSIHSIDRRKNIVLYFLDQLTAEEQVRRGNLSALPALRSVSDIKLKKLFKIAEETKQTAIKAELLDVMDARRKTKSASSIFAI